MTLFIVKDGIDNACVIGKDGKRIFNTNYYSITYNFETNEGYLEKKRANQWRLYTQVGQQLGKSRYHHYETFEQCLLKLQDLKGDDAITVCSYNEIQQYKFR